MRIGLDAGLPLAWVPRTELVAELVAAAGPAERAELLDAHVDDILDDCSAVLATEVGAWEWARECGRAVDALRDGYDSPAQSHAGNIVDSIVVRVFLEAGQSAPGKGIHLANVRSGVAERAQVDFDEVSLRALRESLTVHPLLKAFAHWFPAHGSPPPHFARHATAHAVGHRGLFTKRNALVAVMLATSLTCQFWDDPRAPASAPEDQ